MQRLVVRLVVKLHHVRELENAIQHVANFVQRVHVCAVVQHSVAGFFVAEVDHVRPLLEQCGD